MRKGALLFSLLIPGFSAFAEQGNPTDATSGNTYFSNPVFITLLAVCIFLVVILMVLADVIKNIGKGLKTNQHTSKIATVFVLLFLLSSIQLSAQTEGVTASKDLSYGGLSPIVFWWMIAALVFLVVIVASLLIIIRNMISVEEQSVPVPVNASVKAEEPSFLDKLNDSVAIDKEKDILMDHNYDGIRELDNNLPPWWIYGFYATIIFAFAYLIHYHITRTGDLPLAEYKNEMKAAEAEQAEFQKKSKNQKKEKRIMK
jgi:cytochrome c oxidase cbb3-type subunit 3